MVAPHAGAWIEIIVIRLIIQQKSVAPHAGAWIEISLFSISCKYRSVAPHAGAWIEIFLCCKQFVIFFCRPSRRGVD